jgi:hypothetical protein
MEPKYEEYTYKELLDVRKNINREAYPARFQKVTALLKKYQNAHAPASSDRVTVEQIESTQSQGIYTTPPKRNLDDNGAYIANEIPLKTRIINLIVALCLLAYGLHGLYAGEIYIPSRSKGGIHLYQESVWIMFVALMCGAGVFLSIVLDHYDKRDNEHVYFKRGQMLKNIGIALFCVAVIWEIVVVR